MEASWSAYRGSMELNRVLDLAHGLYEDELGPSPARPAGVSRGRAMALTGRGDLIEANCGDQGAET